MPKKMKVVDLQDAIDTAAFATPDDAIDHDVEAMPVVIKNKGQSFARFVETRVVDGCVIIEVAV